MRFPRLFKLFLVLFLSLVLLGRSSLPPGDRVENVRANTRSIEFDYVSWTLNALSIKVSQYALGIDKYLPRDTRRLIVLDYLDLVKRIQQAEARLNDIYADPNVVDPLAASVEVRQHLGDYYNERAYLAPLAETILQRQISTILAALDLTLGYQPIPPILFQSTSLPLALVVSPRHTIHQDANISLGPDLSVGEQVALEERVDSSINVSSLVVPIGGVGVYPTMVMESTDLNWLSEVVAHEWVHNFLTLRPLGINYMTNSQLRTMNETAASIAGKEIGRAVVEAYYPELLPPPPAPLPQPSQDDPAAEPGFEFRTEMRITRITVDNFLAEGRIEEAEDYMEEQRRLLWDNGYRIRKLNQAYFAFYGAYADEPGGAAGEDPVGAAVRALRARSSTLSAFLNRISWMSSFEQLQQVVKG